MYSNSSRCTSAGKALSAISARQARIAGVKRRHIRRTLLSHRRTDAVGAHQQIRLDVFAIGKMRVDSVRVCVNRQSAPAMIVTRAEKHRAAGGRRAPRP